MNILTPSTTTISNTSSLSNTNLVNSYLAWNSTTTYAASTSYSPVIVTWNNGWYESLAGSNLNFLPSNTAKWKYIGPSLLPVATQAENQAYTLGQIVYDLNNYYKCLQNGSNFNNDYTNPTKWQNLGVVNSLRQFDQYNYTSTVGHYNIKYNVEVPNVKDSNMKALSITGLKNADTITLKVSPSPSATRLDANIIPINNAIHIDAIWPGIDYDTVNMVGIPYTINNNVEVEPVKKIIDENLNTIWNQTYGSNSYGYPAVFTIKLNFPMCIKKVRFVTSNESSGYDPTSFGVYANNTNFSYSQVILVSAATSISFPSARSTETDDYNLNNTSAYLYYTFSFSNTTRNVKITDIILYYDSNDPKAEKVTTQWKYINLGTAKPAQIQYLPTANYLPISWSYPNQINYVKTTGNQDYPPEMVDKLFDEDIYTKYYEDQIPSIINEHKWISIIVKLNWQWCVQKIQFVTANDWEGRDPTSYAAFGSKDGITWDLIGYDSNLVLPSARNTASSIYNLNNMDQYLYYKVTFNKTKTFPINTNGTVKFEYQLSELRLLYDDNDREGYNIRGYNQFSNANALGALAYTNTKRVILAENQAISKIYYNDSDLEDITNFKTATITGLPQGYQLLINRVYKDAANNKLFAVGGDLAAYSPAILISQDNGTTWSFINLSSITVPVNASGQTGPFPLSPIWDLVYCGGSINKYVAIGYNNEILTSTNGTTWTYHSSISSSIYGAMFAKMNWTDNHGGVLVTTGIVQLNNQNKPGIAYTQNLTTWVPEGDSNNFWYNNVNCVSYVYDSVNNLGLWLAAGIEIALMGMWIDYTTPQYPYFFSRTSTLFTQALQMEDDGVYNDIIPSTTDIGWVLCGGGKLNAETARSGKIVSYTYPVENVVSFNAVLLHKDTANPPYSFNSIIAVENIYLASIRTSLANNKPIYYRKDTLTSQGGGTAKNFGLFTTGLSDTAADYDKLNYQIEVTGSTNIQIANAMLHDTTLVLGNTQRGAGLSIVDYSVKNVDEFGNITLIERLTSNRVSVTVLVAVEDINRIQSILNSVRAKPCVWSGSNLAKYQSLTLYGFYRNYEISLDNPKLATLTLELESLV